jgi:hypothetical protein
MVGVIAFRAISRHPKWRVHHDSKADNKAQEAEQLFHDATAAPSSARMTSSALRPMASFHATSVAPPSRHPIWRINRAAHF